MVPYAFQCAKFIGQRYMWERFILHSGFQTGVCVPPRVFPKCWLKVRNDCRKKDYQRTRCARSVQDVLIPELVGYERRNKIGNG